MKIRALIQAKKNLQQYVFDSLHLHYTQEKEKILIEFFQYILNVPKYVILFVLKFIVAILNLIPLPWIKICSEEFFLKYSPSANRSMPERYLIELPLVIHLDCFLIAYIRQAYQKREAHVIEEINIDEVNLHKKDIKIISKTIKRSILETDLKKIIEDYKIIKS